MLSGTCTGVMIITGTLAGMPGVFTDGCIVEWEQLDRSREISRRIKTQLLHSYVAIYRFLALGVVCHQSARTNLAIMRIVMRIVLHKVHIPCKFLGVWYFLTPYHWMQLQ